MSAQKKKQEKTETAAQVRTMVSKDIAQELPARSISDAAFATVIRAHLQNWRQGTVGCKDRSEVSYTNKKPFKQKGTGRARAGSARSPLWRGGGVVFGPQPRVRSLKVLKHVKKSTLASLLQQRLAEGSIHILDWQLTSDAPKTALAHQALQQAQLNNKSVAIFLKLDDVLHYASFRNLPYVTVISYDAPDVFNLAKATEWVILDNDKDNFNQMVSQWL